MTTTNINTMTLEQFNKMRKTATTEEVVCKLIKEKHPCVTKIRKGRYEIRDETHNLICTTRGLKVC